MTSEPRWLAPARDLIGVKEIPGRRHTSRIVQMWVAIGAPFRDDETPWCAAFVGDVLQGVGIKSTKSGLARSYLKWGKKLASPAVGCIVVFERGAGGHVGFVVGQDGRGNLMVLGGNQGNAVNIKPFPKSRVLGYRWPSDEPYPKDYTLPRVKTAAPISVSEASYEDDEEPVAPPKTGVTEATTVASAASAGGIAWQIWEAAKEAPESLWTILATAATRPGFWVFAGVTTLAAFLLIWRQRVKRRYREYGEEE